MLRLNAYTGMLLVLGTTILTSCGGQNPQNPDRSPSRDIPGHISFLPDGSRGYVITCDGFSGMTDCVKRAGDICLEKGYVIIESNDDPGLIGKPILQIHRGMTIRCKTIDGLYPGDQPISIK